jgi:hypothetical protein
MRCGLAFLTTLTQRKQGTLLSSGWIKDHSIDTTQPQVLRQRHCRKHFPVKTKDQTVAATMAAPHSGFGERPVQRLRRGYLSCRLAGRPVGPNVHMPRPTGRTAEPAPHIGERRFSGIAGQQRRHRHGRVVVAVQTRHVEFAGIGHQVGQGRRAEVDGFRRN